MRGVILQVHTGIVGTNTLEAEQAILARRSALPNARARVIQVKWLSFNVLRAVQRPLNLSKRRRLVLNDADHAAEQDRNRWGQQTRKNGLSKMTLVPHGQVKQASITKCNVFGKIRWGEGNLFECGLDADNAVFVHLAVIVSILLRIILNHGGWSITLQCILSRFATPVLPCHGGGNKGFICGRLASKL
jgi:hypothetical protein